MDFQYNQIDAVMQENPLLIDGIVPLSFILSIWQNYNPTTHWHRNIPRTAIRIQFMVVNLINTFQGIKDHFQREASGMPPQSVESESGSNK